MDLAEEGRSIAALDDKPELSPLVQAAVDLFWLLSGGRPVGFAVGPIPTADILLSAQAFGLPPDWFLYLCRVMDNEFLKHHVLKEPKPPEQKPALKAGRQRVS